MERSVFKEKENEIIESVGTSLRTVFNFIKDNSTVYEIFQNILQIFEELRANIARHTDDKGLTTEVKIEIAEVQREKITLQELRLFITKETRNRVFASLAWPTKTSKQTNVLVLTPGGYRQTTAERIDMDRFNQLGRARMATYSLSSYTNIRQFLENVHYALKKALAAQS